MDHLGVCVVFFCHDGNGRFLLSKRTNKARDEHETWDSGGGGVNFGEPVLKTLAREIKEEYCTDVIEAEFLGYRDVHRKVERIRQALQRKTRKIDLATCASWGACQFRFFPG